jgi:hypothetical protein
MTTWNPTVAAQICRRLHDVNFYTARAKVLIGLGQFDPAREAVGRAIAAKLGAVDAFPDFETPGDRLGLSFRELYDLLAAIEILNDALWDRLRLAPDAFFAEPAAAVRFLEGEIARLRDFGNHHWPEGSRSPCRDTLNAFIDALEANAAAMGSTDEVLSNARGAVYTAQIAFLNCLEDDCPLDLPYVYVLLYSTDRELMRGYDRLREVAFLPEQGRILRAHALGFLEQASGFKENLMVHLNEVFPGVGDSFNAPDWEPAPDPLPPWPPGDAG